MLNLTYITTLYSTSQKYLLSILLSLTGMFLYISLIALNLCRTSESQDLWNKGYCPKQFYVSVFPHPLLSYIPVEAKYELNLWIKSHLLLTFDSVSREWLIFVGALLEVITEPTIVAFSSYLLHKLI